MRKRTVKNLFDNIMWYIIYLLPILVGVISVLSLCGGDWYAIWYEADGDYASSPAYALFMSNFHDFSYNFSFYSIHDALAGVLELIGGENVPWRDDALTYYFAYFISVYIFHLFVDFVLFIPRLCHKWMNAFTNAE